MAATFIRGGTFLPSEDNSPRNATIDCTGADFLVVRLRCYGADTLSGITFNGDALTLNNPAAWGGSVQQYVLTSPDQVSGTLAMSITDGYGRVIGEWEAWSGITGTGTAFGTSGTDPSPTSGSRTVAAGSGVSVGAWDNYAPSMVSSAGTAVGTASYDGGSGWRFWGAYRTDTGSMSFGTSPDSSYWEMVGLPLTGAGGPPPVLSSPTSTADDATSATIGVTSDTVGTAYSLLLPAADPAPADAAALIGDPGAVARTIAATGVPQTFSVTGLTTGVALRVHWAMAGSNVASSTSFTPTEPPPPSSGNACFYGSVWGSQVV